MGLQVTRWSRANPPTEEELLRLFQAEGLRPYRWSNAPATVYPVHTHPYDKVLMVVAGSITWTFPQSGETVETRPGDRLDLPRDVEHAAQVGPQGVVCLEAWRSPR